MSIAALVAWGLAGALLVLLALDVPLPGGVDDVAPQGADPILVGRAVTALGYVGLACAGAGMVLAAAQTRAPWARAALVGVGVAGAALAGSLIELSRIVATYNELLIERDLFTAGTAMVVRVLGIIAMVAAVAVAVVPRSWIRRARRTAIAVAAAPFGCGLVVYVYVRVAAKGEAPTAADVAHPQALAAQALVALVAGAGFVVGALLLWQTVVGVRASRDIGFGMARAARRWRSLVLWLLGAKVAWLVSGYLGLLPAWVGGNLDTWDATRSDDWLSWLIVVAAAGAVVVLLLARTSPTGQDEEEPTAAAGAVAAGLTLFLLGGTIALFISAILGIAPDSGLRRAVRDAGEWFAEGLLMSQVVVVYGAGLVGAGLLALRRWRAAAAVLLLFFAWSLPRAIDITIHGENIPAGALGRPELATLDAAVTVALVMVAAAALLRPAASSRLELVGLILAASTSLVYAGQLLGAVWPAGAFYVGLIFPAAYRFAFAARSLNRARPDREARLLIATGVAAALLTIATVQIDSGFLSADTLGMGQLGRALLAAPFAAVLVALSPFAASEQARPGSARPGSRIADAQSTR